MPGRRINGSATQLIWLTGGSEGACVCDVTCSGDCFGVSSVSLLIHKKFPAQLVQATCTHGRQACERYNSAALLSGRTVHFVWCVCGVWQPCDVWMCEVDGCTTGRQAGMQADRRRSSTRHKMLYTHDFSIVSVLGRRWTNA
mmetsp:Transcript_256/g.424  ORF Transcript_256/g.424 Transcript_256/m.424 type:complete len:142 (-) Transcript_256:36-461(-)